MHPLPRLPVLLLASLLFPLGGCGNDQPSAAPAAPTASAVAAAATPAGPPSAPPGNQPPIAIFKVTPEPDRNGRGVIRGKSPFTVKFNMCASHDADGDGVLYTHDFDGDGIDELKGFGGNHCRVSHSYVFTHVLLVQAQRFEPRQCLTDTDPATGQHLHPKQCTSYVVEVLKK